MKRSLANHQEVAHVWASQSQHEGEASHLFFEGPSIYSYGHHFEIARIVKPGVVLFNSARYSNSTAKHQSRTYSAVSHMRVYTVPSMTDHKANAAYLIKQLEDELFRLGRARKYVETGLDMYQGNADKALEYADEFKKEIGAKLYNAILKVWERRNEPFTPAIKKAFEAKAKAQREKSKAERVEREARAAARKAELQKDYDAWKAGEIASLPYEAQNLFPVALRITTDTEDGGKMIQTSKGARVPVIEARKLYHALAASPDVAGMRVGHYTVTGVRGTDLIVGCHVIPLREVARMAVTLGFTKEGV